MDSSETDVCKHELVVPGSNAAKLGVRVCSWGSGRGGRLFVLTAGLGRYSHTRCALAGISLVVHLVLEQ